MSPPLRTLVLAVALFALGVLTAPRPSQAEECATGTDRWAEHLELVGVTGSDPAVAAQHQAFWGPTAFVTEGRLDAEDGPTQVRVFLVRQ